MTSPVHVQRQEFVPEAGQRTSIDVKAWFPPSRDGILMAISELDSAYDEARQRLVGMIESS